MITKDMTIGEVVHADASKAEIFSGPLRWNGFSPILETMTSVILGKTSEKLFTFFGRLHPETQFEGTGMGLAIAWHIVERHSGRIWVEAAPKKGATFYFTLN